MRSNIQLIRWVVGFLSLFPFSYEQLTCKIMDEPLDDALRYAATPQTQPPTPTEAIPPLAHVHSPAISHGPREEEDSLKPSHRRPRSLSRPRGHAAVLCHFRRQSLT